MRGQESLLQTSSNVNIGTVGFLDHIANAVASYDGNNFSFS